MENLGERWTILMRPKARLKLQTFFGEYMKIDIYIYIYIHIPYIVFFFSPGYQLLIRSGLMQVPYPGAHRFTAKSEPKCWP